MANEYGVTKYGFIKKTADKIRTDYARNLKAAFPGIDTSSDSVGGQLIGIFDKATIEFWEGLEAVYKSFYLNSAEGISLDDIGKLIGIPRLGASKSEARAVGLKGSEGTLINTTKIIQTIITNHQFKNKRDVTISINSSMIDVVEVTTVTDSLEYVIKIDEITASINSGVGATAISIANDLVDKINIDTLALGVNAELPAVPDGTFKIFSNDLALSFTPIFDIKLTVNEFWTPADFVSIETGDIEAPSGSLIVIVTPTAGLDEVNNYLDAFPGREIESDSDYRLRIKLELSRLGGGNLEAIVARMYDVEDVTDVVGFENRLLATDSDGRPGKSIEIILQGGNDQGIANKLWLVKGGGIQTFGDVDKDVTDSKGKIQDLHFSRPEEVYIWVRAALTVTDLFPPDGIQTIENNLLLLGRAFGIGEDIAYQKFFCPCYSVSGVESVVLEIAETATPTPPPTGWITVNIDINYRQIGLFDSSRIEVTVP